MSGPSSCCWLKCCTLGPGPWTVRDLRLAPDELPGVSHWLGSLPAVWPELGSSALQHKGSHASVPIGPLSFKVLQSLKSPGLDHVGKHSPNGPTHVVTLLSRQHPQTVHPFWASASWPLRYGPGITATSPEPLGPTLLLDQDQLSHPRSSLQWLMVELFLLRSRC